PRGPRRRLPREAAFRRAARGQVPLARRRGDRQAEGRVRDRDLLDALRCEERSRPRKKGASMSRPRIVVLDDYEDSLRRTADWQPIQARADVEVHTERLRGDALLAAVRDADAIVVVRDRTPFKAELLARLPKLRLFIFTGARNTQLDTEAL